MTEVTIVGLDLAKRVFRVHGATADGGVAICKKLSRGQVLAFFADMPPCLVAMEACAAAHYWAREIGALGHNVSWVSAFCSSSKGICSFAPYTELVEAISRWETFTRRAASITFNVPMMFASI